ncbi:GNAT family N-acetyltransferase [Micromonospora sp. NPDC048839]|uniref:GNAT family N-acetyltransferase n=1 Tax=Micromonospora sp. NPDC048839 TaxID=3155641 RepID=UPI0033EC7EB0
MIARPATQADVASIATMLTAELHTDPIAEWLVPDAGQRPNVFHRLLAIEIDHAVERRDVDVLVDMSAVAMWSRSSDDDRSALADYHLSTATGRYLPRFQQLTSALCSYRSAAPHHWLSWLSVHPDFRRQGLARALLVQHHQVVDELGYPISAVVTTEAARDFLTAHGYHAALPLHLPSGPVLWPLTRHGRPARRGGTRRPHDGVSRPDVGCPDQRNSHQAGADDPAHSLPTALTDRSRSS